MKTAPTMEEHAGSRSYALSAVVVLLCALALGAFITSAARAAPSSDPLHVLAWPDAFASDTLRDFRLSTGIPVVVEPVQSAEDLLRRVSSSSSRHDLVLAPDYLIPMLRDRELLAPLDSDQLLHLADLDPRFESRADDPGHRFSVPHVWGTTGIAWRADRVAEPLRSWAQVLVTDAPWAGHVSMVGDGREALGAALKALGHSANSLKSSEINQARDLLVAQPGLSVHRGSAVAGRVAFGASWISQAWSDDIASLRRKGVKRVRFVVPEEGGIFWLDAITILSRSRRSEDAHRFINYLSHPRTAALTSANLGLASPSLSARRLLPRSVRTDPAIYPPVERLDRCEFLRDVGSATPLYDKAWYEVLRAAGVEKGVR